MITCAEARRLLYDTETTIGHKPTLAEPGSMLALAKAHVTVCLACNDYFEHERAFIAAVGDRVGSLGVTVPQTAVAGVLTAIAKERLSGFNTAVKKDQRGFLVFLKKLFSKSG